MDPVTIIAYGIGFVSFTVGVLILTVAVCLVKDGFT